jgi:hypothetical protein
MNRLVPTRTRHRVALGAAVVAVVLALLSPLFGRAPVSGQYRPLVPADGLANGCYPLPGGVVPDFDYVLRRDGDTVDSRGLHRRVVLHYDNIDADGAAAMIRAQLADAGVGDEVRVWAHDFEGVPDDAPDDRVVRGEMVLDLPVVAVASDSPVCDDANSTKRFAPDLLDRS